MKITKVILTLAAILLILGLIAVIFPKDGVQIGGLNLQFPSLHEVFFEEKPQYADIEQIVDEENIEIDEDKKVQRVALKDGTVVNIELPENNPEYLDDFFKAMNRIADKGDNVRIMHYGDSQIEGDRITSYLRQRLQGEFGGEGQGEIPLHSLSNIKNVEYQYSDNWEFFSIIDTKKTIFHNYGLMQNAAVTNTDNEFINLKFAKAVSGNMTLYCGAKNSLCGVQIFSGDSLIKEFDINNQNTLTALPFRVNNPVKSLKIQTKGEMELYSLDFSGKSGVYVDNVSLRGSSGDSFSKNDSAFFAMMNDNLNVKLIFFQFGVNAVPQQDDVIMKSYHYYKVMLVKQIRFLQKTNPNAAIVVIGISDRSRKKGNGYETNPNIPMIIAVQKEAARQCGVAFWNLFEAMGGENSMPSWVLREKPLANTDFTHFNDRGAKYVGEMFYKAIENAYFDYQNR